MEELLDWMVRAEALSAARRRDILGGGGEDLDGDKEWDRSSSASPCTAVSRLMEELRTGMALAKIAVKLDKKISLDKINNRPSLMWQRDQNVRLFLGACRSRGISPAFEPADLECGSNAAGVLATLRDAAKKSTKDGAVQGGGIRDKAAVQELLRTSSCNLSDPSSPSRDSASSKMYASGHDLLRSSREKGRKARKPEEDGGGGGGESANSSADGDIYYLEHIAVEEKCVKKTPLENNIAELIGTETRYAQKLSLLPDLVEDYPERQRDGAVFSLLRDMTGQIRRVLALHQDLRAALEGAEKKRLPLVLAEFKSRLLVYGPFIEQCSNAWRTLSNMKGEQSINKEIESARALIAKQEARYAYHHTPKRVASSSSSSLPVPAVGLQELLLCPFQHVMRYHLHLDTMAASAGKQVAKGGAIGTQEWVNEFYENVKPGLLAMSDLNHYLNEYKRDSEVLSDYSNGLQPERVRTQRLLGGEHFDLATAFGRLLFDGKAMHWTGAADGKRGAFKSRYFLAFQEVLLVCDVQPKSGAVEETYEAIQLVGTSSVKEARADESSLQLELLVVNPETKLARENCCVFKLRSAKALRELQSSFRDLIKVKHSRLHSSCEVGRWALARDYPDLLEAPLTCQLPGCGMMLRGRITLGIVCPSCDKVFHEECFYTGKSPFAHLDLKRKLHRSSTSASAATTASANTEDDDDDEARYARQGVTLGCGDDQTKDDLRDSPRYEAGTYLLYKDEKDGQLKMAVKAPVDHPFDGKPEFKLKKYFLDRRPGDGRYRVRGKGEIPPEETVGELLGGRAREELGLGENYAELGDVEEEEVEEEEGNEDCEEDGGGESFKGKEGEEQIELRNFDYGAAGNGDHEDFDMSVHLWNPCPKDPRELLLNKPPGTYLVATSPHRRHRCHKTGEDSFCVYFWKNENSSRVSKKTLRRDPDGGGFLVGEKTYEGVEEFLKSSRRTLVTPLAPPNNYPTEAETSRDLLASSSSSSSRPESSRSTDSAATEASSSATSPRLQRARAISASTEAKKQRSPSGAKSRPTNFPSSLSAEASKDDKKSPSSPTPSSATASRSLNVARGGPLT